MTKGAEGPFQVVESRWSGWWESNPCWWFGPSARNGRFREVSLRSWRTARGR